MSSRTILFSVLFSETRFKKFWILLKEKKKKKKHFLFSDNFFNCGKLRLVLSTEILKYLDSVDLIKNIKFVNLQVRLD
jgi:hypothetical protein